MLYNDGRSYQGVLRVQPSKRLARNESRTQVQVPEKWQLYAQSDLAKWMLLFNVLGAIAHLTGVIVALTVARREFRLSTWMVQPVNDGTVDNPKMTAAVVFVGWVYPTTIIVAFFGLSLGFHVTISAFLCFHLSVGPGKWTNWYMKGMYYCVAPWVRYDTSSYFRY